MNVVSPLILNLKTLPESSRSSVTFVCFSSAFSCQTICSFELSDPFISLVFFSKSPINLFVSSHCRLSQFFFFFFSQGSSPLVSWDNLWHHFVLLQSFPIYFKSNVSSVNPWVTHRRYFTIPVFGVTWLDFLFLLDSFILFRSIKYGRPLILYTFE